MKSSPENALPTTLIIGAYGTIAKAIISNIKRENIIAISRQSYSSYLNHLNSENNGDEQNPRIEWITCNQSEISIKHTANTIKQLLNNRQSYVSHVYICIGQLHNNNYGPEKRIENLSIETMQDTFHINTILPSLWLKQLITLCKSNHSCRVGVISARVGSIEDNHLGGWYSYRASKAALNMVIKTASIEYARRAKNIKLAALHPGTVDSPLSKPFQSNVPSHKLFTPTQSAQYLIEQLENMEIDGTADFVAWNGEKLPW